MEKAELKLTAKFLRYLLPYRIQALTVILLGLLGVILSLVTPYITKLVIDRAFADKDLRLFIILASLGASVFIVSLIASSLQNYLDRYIQIKVNFDLSKTVFRHLNKLDLSYFENSTSSEHTYKISSDIDRAKTYITNLLTEALAIFPKLILTIAIIFYLNWKLALFSLCLAPLLYLPS